jgi:hypothetical protein
MPTHTTINRTITIKKHTITRLVISGKSSTQSIESALAQAMSDLISNIPNSSAKN